MVRRLSRWVFGLATASIIVATAACSLASGQSSTAPEPITGALAGEPAAEPARGSLTGQFLVATPSMADPRFAHTVIFIVSHDDKGAMGLVINRAYGEGSLSKLLTGFGVTDQRDTNRIVRLYYGGPVEPERGFVLHSPDYRGPSTQQVDSKISLSTGKDVLEAIAEGKGPSKVMFIIGYAGWGAGQLEREMARDDWLTAPVDAHLIFSDDPDATWSEVYQAAGLTL